MRRSSIPRAFRNAGLPLLLFFVAACQGQDAGMTPGGPPLRRAARIISSVVQTGSHSYVVDELQTPRENNLLGITAGPNGDVWFTGDAPLVGKSTIRSDMSDFLFSKYSDATSIAEGPDHNAWVTLVPAAIAKVSTSGRITIFPLGPRWDNASSITNGPDKSLWFAAGLGYIARISIAGKVTRFSVGNNSEPESLMWGNDGALWFTDIGTNKIGRMTAGGRVAEFSVPMQNAGLAGIAQGPDGNVWFLESAANKVGSMTPSGVFHEYSIPTPYSRPVSIVAGPDGSLWFTEILTAKIGRITTSGAIEELPLSKSFADPTNITVGSDKNVWFTEGNAYGILGRVDLHEVKDSDPAYSTISLSLNKVRAELGRPEKLPLSIVVRNLRHRKIEGQYTDPIHLTTTDRRQAALSQSVVKSSDSTVNVLFSGHYADALINASANGGGIVQPATVVPSTQPDKKLPSAGFGITRGAHDSLWMCLENGSIATYSKSGALRVYAATTWFGEEGCSMVQGPDGNVWFTDYSNDRIGKITPRGHVTFFQLEHDASPYAMALGSDGALWFTEFFPGKIGRITTAGQITTFKGHSTPLAIVAGPDGNLWYIAGGGTIYKLTTSGKSTAIRHMYGLSFVWSFDGAIWFLSPGYPNYLEEMSPNGSIIKKYKTPYNCSPWSVAFGPENSIWYLDPAENCVARMTLSGKFYIAPTYDQSENSYYFSGMVVGPNGYLWFTAGKDGFGWVDPRWI